MSKLFLLLAFFGIWAQADFGEKSPRVVVHLLDYIAMDYSGAVRGDRILDAAEYQEQIDFAKELISTVASIDDFSNDPFLKTGMDSLLKQIEQKEHPEKVASLCRKLEARAIQVSKLQLVPLHWPKRSNGKVLYERNCATCHGNTGHGDGPTSTNLDPKPANFHDAKMDELPPYQLFHAIRLGLPGTSMPSFANFSDQETWDIVFYLMGLRYEGEKSAESIAATVDQAAGLTDRKLRETLGGARALRDVRLYEPAAMASLAVAREELQEVRKFIEKGQRAEAREKSIMVYLEGFEPFEPILRSRAAGLVTKVERSMAELRNALQTETAEVIEGQIDSIDLLFREAESILKQKPNSEWFVFSAAIGIVLREGLEAALILITLAGILRAMKARRAMIYVHAGWISALVMGWFAWIFSGKLIGLSGAGREWLEGAIGLFAVSVLLYVGFWLHRKTEITRWREFIDEKVKAVMEERNLLGLAFISFMAVFREAFETVLFLRALVLDGGSAFGWTVGAGVLVSIGTVILASAVIVRFSVRLPVRQLFSISATILFALSVTLVGKSIHSFQEVGAISYTPISLPFESEFLGLHGSVETTLAQVALIAIALGVRIFERARAR